MVDDADAAIAEVATKLKAKRTVAATAKSEAKGRARTPRLSRAKSAGGNLVCRYCGSGDLAPSFIKRRDARCRACFKQRYGSAARNENTTQTRKPAMTK